MMLIMQPEILLFKVLRTSGFNKRNQYEFRKHQKIEWLDGGLVPSISGLPVHSSTNKKRLTTPGLKYLLNGRTTTVKKKKA